MENDMEQLNINEEVVESSDNRHELREDVWRPVNFAASEAQLAERDIVAFFMKGELHFKPRPGQMIKQREDQVKNHVGGWVFKVSDETRVRRFLILGTSGGTYYATEKEHTMESVKALIEIIERGKADMIIREIYDISLSGRAPKQSSTLFALALCARYQVHDVKKVLEKGDASDEQRTYAKYISAMHKAAFDIVNEVCRIPTHLFQFVEYCELIAKETNSIGSGKSTGWGRQMRKAIQDWYLSKPADRLAMLVTKYPQRNGWSHRDLFRLAHPKISSSEHGQMGAPMRLVTEQLFRYVVKNDLVTRKRKLTPAEWDVEQPQKKYSGEQMDREEQSRALDMIEMVLSLKKNPTEKEQQALEAIPRLGLVREHLPTELLNSVPIWHALLKKMPMTAMIRNLGKISAIGALDDEHTAIVVKQLTDEAQLKAAKIHPVSVLMAKSVYAKGCGEKGKLKWTVNAKVDAALEEAFYKSFINAPPTNKRILFAFDVSGSMTCQISGTSISCRTASAALSLVSLRNEKDVECVGFSHDLIELPYRGDWKLKQIEDHMNGLPFGATDCALPMLWAIEKQKKFDVFIVYTDCETYFGEVHPFEAMRRYRESSGIADAKLVVMGMTATDFTIADPTDAGMLDIAGFDSAVPQLLYDFVGGKV